MQVERIAACYWRLGCAQRAEVGEIRKDLDIAVFRDQIELRLGPQAKWDEETQTFARTSRKMSQAVGSLLSHIDELEKSRKEPDNGTAEHTEETSVDESDGRAAWQRMRQIPEEAARGIRVKRMRDAGYGESDIRSSEELWESHGEELKEFEEGEREWREQARGIGKGMADVMGATLAVESNYLRLSVPSKEAVDKILRYETAIERQLYRAINQLERLQRRRRGDIVPPPINVELSTE